MIAVLTRIFGIHNLELVEDTVQETFLKALQAWRFNAVPDNPSAWLMQVARNRTIDLIRRQQKLADISGEVRIVTRGRLRRVIEGEIHRSRRAHTVNHAVVHFRRQRPAPMLETDEEHGLPQRLRPVERVREELTRPGTKLRVTPRWR